VVGLRDDLVQQQLMVSAAQPVQAGAASSRWSKARTALGAIQVSDHHYSQVHGLHMVLAE